MLDIIPDMFMSWYNHVLVVRLSTFSVAVSQLHFHETAISNCLYGLNRLMMVNEGVVNLIGGHMLLSTKESYCI